MCYLIIKDITGFLLLCSFSKVLLTCLKHVVQWLLVLVILLDRPLTHLNIYSFFKWCNFLSLVCQSSAIHHKVQCPRQCKMLYSKWEKPRSSHGNSLECHGEMKIKNTLPDLTGLHLTALLLNSMWITEYIILSVHCTRTPWWNKKTGTFMSDFPFFCEVYRIKHSQAHLQ